MSDKPENPLAYPNAVPKDFQYAETGMTLRDYFAGQYLMGRASRNASDHQATAEYAYQQADAMLEARETGQ